MPGWYQSVFSAKKGVTTWKLRAAALLVVTVLGVGTHEGVVAGIAWSLVCREDLMASDALVVENFVPHYVLFERAATLQRTGLGPRALVSVEAAHDPDMPNPVSRGVADLMARQARMTAWEFVPIREVEPISLNAARQIRDLLVRERIASITIVTPAFRSRRSWLVYQAELDGAGTTVRCVPVFGRTSPEGWTATWHGVKEVADEFLKLQYYRAWVLPLRGWTH
jgi:hypothetical protein